MTIPARVNIFCYRYPLAQPMETVFGPVLSRPALVVRLEDSEGAVGWGEIWCNFPQPGAEYRARLAEAVLPNALRNLDLGQPAEAFQTVRSRLHRVSLQAGEPGPVDQIASGVDLAVHDLAARRQGIPLATLLGGAPRALRPYASGIDSRLALEMIGAAQEKGYRAYKLRVGFGRQSAIDAMTAAQSTMHANDFLMVDANQNWDRDEAIDMVKALSDAPLSWVEEPLPVDRPDAEWAAVAAASPFPIAGGENMRSAAEFDGAIANDLFGVIQPDICKWGGLSLCAPIARRVIAAGKRYCPHYLGGGIGLMASAHLLAAVGGDGLLEIDCNDNALREIFAGPLLPLVGGEAIVPDAPGLGFVPDPNDAHEYLVQQSELNIAKP